MMMALCNSGNHNHPLLFSVFLLTPLMIVIVILLPGASSLSFNFSTFSGSEIRLEGDASISAGGAIQVIGYPPGKSRTGRASYTKPVLLRDKATRNLTDFRTHFSFNTSSSSSSSSSNGNGVLAFFLAPKDSTLPTNATTYLGSASASVNNHNSTSRNTEDRIFAIEFNAVNPSSQPTVNGSSNINNNSTYRDEVCVPFDNTSVASGRRRANVWITYNSTTYNLSIFFTYAEHPVFRGNSTLFYIINLGNYLPDLVEVGFGASSSGSNAVSYSVLDWQFNSTLDIKDDNDIWKRRLMIAASSGGGTALVLIFSFILWKNRNSRNTNRNRKNRGGGRGKDVGSVTLDAPIDNDFEKTSGPKRFAYAELVRSTNNFAEEGKLGEGGFGTVYRGFLADQNKDVAVKKVSKKSKQGVKEFASEVKIISRLRHRNLVQLVGWCHHKEELLLVYEFMPNGSLDSHLFRAKTSLTWEARNKIVLGLASALLYLHEEWDQCVVHRDIKPSNIMLDSNFNAKLGDFGLARLIDHEKTSRMTILAGTLGYMAPETATTWKASKESDVYSFGIVALEIACGRRCIDSKAEEGKMVLLEWVWKLYGNGKLLKAADGKLNMDFNEQQMQCLLTVGLWCAHPDFKFRPSIRQAMQVLKFEAPLPHLPPDMPVSTYAVPVPPLSLSVPPLSKSSTSHCEPIGLTDFEMGRT